MTRNSTAGERPDQAVTAESEQTMGLIEGHVPISLIMDLAVPAGPNSQDILDTEGAPDSKWWLAP